MRFSLLRHERKQDGKAPRFPAGFHCRRQIPGRERGVFYKGLHGLHNHTHTLPGVEGWCQGLGGSSDNSDCCINSDQRYLTKRFTIPMCPTLSRYVFLDVRIQSSPHSLTDTRPGGSGVEARGGCREMLYDSGVARSRRQSVVVS